MAGEADSQASLAVRVSATLGAYCLPRVLPGFRAHCPTVRLILSTSSQRGLSHDLAAGGLELALLLSEPFAAPGLSLEILGREPLVVLVAPGSPLAAFREVRPADLAGQPLFLTPHVWSVRSGLEQALLASRQGQNPVGLVECPSVDIVKRCVMAGLGVSVAPLCALEFEVGAGLLAALPLAGGPIHIPVLLARDAGRPLSPAATAFANALRSFFAARG